MSDIWARLINQYKFKNHTVHSARLDKQDEDDQALDEIELENILRLNQNLTQSVTDKDTIRSQLEGQFAKSRIGKKQLEIWQK